MNGSKHNPENFQTEIHIFNHYEKINIKKIMIYELY